MQHAASPHAVSEHPSYLHVAIAVASCQSFKEGLCEMGLAKSV